MRLCEKCFTNIDLKAIIKSSGDIGDCDFSKEHKNVKTLEIDNKRTIEPIKDKLRQIIDIYTPDEGLPSDFPHEKKDLLQNSLEKRWSIFSIERDSIYRLLNQLFSKDDNFDQRLLKSLVGVESELELDDNKLIVFQNDWEEFVDSIKYHNRFHTKKINLDLLEVFLSYTKKTIKPGEFSLFRCRVENTRVLEVEDMYAPPMGKASPGRLNAEWISALYLGDNEMACIQEVRAGFHDKVHIGEFELKDEIKVVDLRKFEENTIDPYGENLEEYYLNRDTLMKISAEIAKPTNNDDKGIHYLPLQYISDFIKSSTEGYQGILYESVMNENANNLLIFDPNLVICKRVKTKQIKYIDYKI
ncbi:RES family NAD+ phosphorylase [Macrococcoides canis]|uniref:RES family NAD+ phosphorylase n=1 Tax=Macrococcoides canis TaxID=1855823 RepID=UPI001AEC1EF2|nr:RES family NAD+ phosphorylase [Macrococcus canis]QTQ08400.1 RES family NAD+ phosphorylase [Macrococcus canis]